MSASTRTIRMLMLALAAAAVWLWLAPGAEAQCALCRAALEKGGEQTARAMDLGIVVLLVPPVTLFCSIFAVVYKSRGAEAPAEPSRRDDGEES